MLPKYFTVDIYHILFIHSFVDQHSDCFHVFVAVNNAATNIGLQISFWDDVFCFIQINIQKWNYCSCIFNFWRTLCTGFHTCCTSLLLLRLSHFNLVRLCAIPSLGFSRQEYWSGLPFPSPMHKSEKWKWSCSVMFDPMDCSLPGSSVHGIFQARVLEWGATAFSDSFPQIVHKRSLILQIFANTYLLSLW